ncbi:MAG TPA: CoA-transferase [Dissulfurispiraceae bacterium]|nr:CoA-transferase [Dissulfurispiraceae bacterium]
MAESKIVTAEVAVSFIKDAGTVAFGGFVGSGFAEEIAVKIEESFLQSGKPCDLTLIYSAGQGDGKTKGLNHLGHEGLVSRVIGGHIGPVPKLQELVRKNKCLAYSFPLGVVAQLYRDITAKKPGTITHVGIGTFIDPREEGGKLNERTHAEGDDLIELMTIAGKEYLLYKTLPVNVAIIRGTTSDTDGNISIEKEALTLEILNIAMAAKNSCGIVIAQVERITQKGTLSPRHIRVPGILVDYVVQAKPENHWQTFVEPYNPAFSGQVKVPIQSIPPLELNVRKIIARRAAFELGLNSVVNLGIGMPESVARVANEEGLIDALTLTTEPGAIGGIPAGGMNFGASTNVDALISLPEQFDFYDGGGLDTAFLGAAEIDGEGNVNVSKFGTRFVGPGGFINISQNAKKVIFLSTFTAGGLKVSVRDGKLKIDQEGREKKLVGKVQQKTYSGNHGIINKQPVLYVTERCVFELTDKGVELTEIAPGIDVDKEILARMDFRPIVNKPRLMDARIFEIGPMGIKRESAARPACHPEMK